VATVQIITDAVRQHRYGFAGKRISFFSRDKILVPARQPGWS